MNKDTIIAEMQAVLQRIWDEDEMGWIEPGHECVKCGLKNGEHKTDCLQGKIAHAISSDCGKGWLSPEVAKQVRNCLLEIKEWRDSAEKEYLESVDISHPQFYITEALALLDKEDAT